MQRFFVVCGVLAVPVRSLLEECRSCVRTFLRRSIGGSVFHAQFLQGAFRPGHCRNNVETFVFFVVIERITVRILQTPRVRRADARGLRRRNGVSR
jgi:hypothetical protein